MPRRRALRVELPDHVVEGQVLVLVGGDAGLADLDLGHQVGESRVARRVGAHDEGVDEEPDQVLQRVVGAPGDAGADRDVGARAEPPRSACRRRSGSCLHSRARRTLLSQ
nr:hypothetical protein [Saccharopolyspora spinosa]